MYFRLTVENLSHRIFNIAQQEVQRRGHLLRLVDSIGNVKVLLLTCDHVSEIASLVSTLETDRDAIVLFVQDYKGRHIKFRNIPQEETPYFNRHTLSLNA